MPAISAAWRSPNLFQLRCFSGQPGQRPHQSSARSNWFLLPCGCIFILLDILVLYSTYHYSYRDGLGNIHAPLIVDFCFCYSLLCPLVISARACMYTSGAHKQHPRCDSEWAKHYQCLDAQFAMVRKRVRSFIVPSLIFSVSAQRQSNSYSIDVAYELVGAMSTSMSQVRPHPLKQSTLSLIRIRRVHSYISVNRISRTVLVRRFASCRAVRSSLLTAPLISRHPLDCPRFL